MTVWYAALCKPRREALAEANLFNQSYRVYLPRLATQCRRAGKWVDTLEPLFPRYLFVAADNERHSLAPVRSTLGVSDLVRSGGQPATVPEGVVVSLRAKLDSNAGASTRRNLFKPGTKVEFDAGPFAGVDGVFEAEATPVDFTGPVNVGNSNEFSIAELAEEDDRVFRQVAGGVKR